MLLTKAYWKSSNDIWRGVDAEMNGLTMLKLAFKKDPLSQCRSVSRKRSKLIRFLCWARPRFFEPEPASEPEPDERKTGWGSGLWPWLELGLDGMAPSDRNDRRSS